MGKILRMVLLFVSLFSYAALMAQNQETVIKGRVTDEKGVTLPGVTVTVKGLQTNAITNVNGAYSIKVPSGGKTLVYKFIGMETQEVVIGTKTTINVTMQLSSTALREVSITNIGYGSQKRGDVNGAISSVSAKDLQDI